MEGIHYVTDEAGNKIAIQIDLENYGNLVEDFLDVVSVESNKEEEYFSLEEVEQALEAQGKLSEHVSSSSE